MRRLARGAVLALGLPVLTLGVLLGLRALHHDGQTGRPAGLERPAGQALGGAGPVPGGPTCDQVPTVIGRVVVPQVAAYAEPSSTSRVVATFGRRNEQGSAQVFELASVARGGTWYRAILPVRPNGTTGFVPASALALSKTWYRVDVDRADLRLTLWKGCERVHTFPIGLGTVDTPTPVGHFYLASLLKPPTPDTVYGAYAYGLSGYSDVIRNWRWGGIIGLHGTNDPSSIGHRESHGCIRMYNRDISELVRLLPLGTPITIG